MIRIKDRLHRLLAVNAALGVFAGMLVVGAILALDTGSLRSLILGDPAGAVALALLAGGFVVTCASVMMGGAVMLQCRPGQDRGPRGGGRLVPVRVPVRRR